MDMSMDMSSHAMDMLSSMSSSMRSMMDMNMSSMSSSMSSAMSMSMSMGMDMGSEATPAVSSMEMHSHTMSMPMSSSSSMSMPGMDMDMGMDMEMNSYLTIDYYKYPVLFKGFNATTKAQAFGIFVLILVACFVYKFIVFTSWCLEVHWFKKWNKFDKRANVNAMRNSSADRDGYLSDDTLALEQMPKLPNLLGAIFMPNVFEYVHDIIRLCLTFCSTLIIYMLMLVCMTYVLTYVFGVVLGLTLAEIFFNRCKLCLLKRWEIKREIEKTKNCPGGSNCQCGRHRLNSKGNPLNEKTQLDLVSSNSSVPTDYVIAERQETNLEEKSPDCCCGNDDNINDTTAEPKNCECAEDENEEQQIERNVTDARLAQEQSDMMDTTLLPSEKIL